MWVERLYGGGAFVLGIQADKARHKQGNTCDPNYSYDLRTPSCFTLWRLPFARVHSFQLPSIWARFPQLFWVVLKSTRVGCSMWYRILYFMPVSHVDVPLFHPIPFSLSLAVLYSDASLTSSPHVILALCAYLQLPRQSSSMFPSHLNEEKSPPNCLLLNTECQGPCCSSSCCRGLCN